MWELQLPSCNVLLSKCSICAAACLKGPLQPHRELPNLNTTTLLLLYCTSFFPGFESHRTALVQRQPLCPGMRTTDLRPELHLSQKIWNVSVGGKQVKFHKQLFWAMGPLLAARSACQGMMKAKRHRPIIMICFQSCLAFVSAWLLSHYTWLAMSSPCHISIIVSSKERQGKVTCWMDTTDLQDWCWRCSWGEKDWEQLTPKSYNWKTREGQVAALEYLWIK